MQISDLFIYLILLRYNNKSVLQCSGGVAKKLAYFMLIMWECENVRVCKMH